MSSAEVDVDLYTFIQRYATNLVRWDLLMYFATFPNRRATAGEIARDLRRGERATLKELDDLTYLRVLHRRYADGQATYELSPNGEPRQLVIRLAQVFKPAA